MPKSTYFIQACPTCGRKLRVRVAYLGKNVVCQHCQAEFEACDPDSGIHSPDSSGVALLDRANELLDSVSDLKNRPR